jgi:hypothetical protein
VNERDTKRQIGWEGRGLGKNHKMLGMHHDMAVIKRQKKNKRLMTALPHNGVENMMQEDGARYF